MKDLLRYRDVWLIGAGGKTTLMVRLAAAWAARDQRVLCTTTTRIWPPGADQRLDLRVNSLVPLVADLRQRPGSVVTAVRCILDGKCHGFAPDEALSLAAETDHLVVEADGSAGRPVKAHAPYEPVLAASASCVVALVGSWCVGAPLDAQHVHRPDRFAALTGRRLGSSVTAADVATVILSEQGWLRAVPRKAAFHVVVTGGNAGIIRALERHPRAGQLAGVHLG